MNQLLYFQQFRSIGLLAIATAAICLQGISARGESLLEVQKQGLVSEQGVPNSTSFDERVQVSYNTYILGPGDVLEVELLDLPELSGSYAIGPDGTIYLPRLRALNVEGLTIEELRSFLVKQFRPYVLDPQVYVRPLFYRPVRIYIGGEVKRPGYYTLTGVQDLSPISTSDKENNTERSDGTGLSRTFGIVFPTVFDAIRAAQGITPFTNLSKVEITRKRADGIGGGRIRTEVNFLSLITEGDESQNIRLFDGDVLTIDKSPMVLREQLLKAGQTNLSPQFINVFVTGRVEVPGNVTIPQGSSLNQAISLAGGVKTIRGKIEFVRFDRQGTIDRRIFSYNEAAVVNSPNNPILASGDIIRVKNSILSNSVNVLNELTSPFVGIYSVYSLFNGLSQ